MIGRKGQGRDCFGLAGEGSIRIPKPTWGAWDREKTGTAAFDPLGLIGNVERLLSQPAFGACPVDTLRTIQNMTVMAYACRRRTDAAAECASLSYRSPRVAQGLARRTLSPRWPYSRIGPGELNAFAGPLPQKVTPGQICTRCLPRQSQRFCDNSLNAASVFEASRRISVACRALRQPLVAVMSS